jgi:hypothetical protein
MEAEVSLDMEKLVQRTNDPPETGPRFFTLYEQGLMAKALREHNRNAELHQQILADYDRRRSHWWGRFLLWLLRKTT